MWSSPEENLEDRSSTVFRKNTNSARQKQRCYLSYKKFEHTEYNMDNNRAFRGRRRGMNYRWHKYDRKNHYFEHSGTPYATGIKNRRGKYSDGDQYFLSAWEDRKYNEREMTSDVHSETVGNWFKVTIPSGRKYDKTWLMKSIQNLCSVPFSPVDFHYDKHQARFFVQDARTASALKDVSYRICDNTNRKICIFVTPSVVPYSVKNKLTSEQMELLKVTVMKRYDASHKALDLEKLRFDQELMDNDIDMMLNRRSCMVATLQIIQSNIPELLSLNLCNNKLYQLDGLSDVIEKAPQVKILNLSRNKLKSVLELEKVKELKLEELWLEGNPFCNKYADQSDYISAVRDLFPKLLRLDGKELVEPKKMDVEVPPQASKETTKESEFIKNLIVQFLKEYYLFYDSGDRLRLLDAYHDEACFSLVIPFNFNDPNMSNLEEYFKYNRDIKKMKDSYMRLRLLKHTKRDIVDSLSLLPKTQHDFCSFWVDMCFHTDMMLCFSVNGLFKEVEGKCQGCIRAFTRIFIAVPGMNSRICIINDELIVRNATPSEIKKAFNSQSTPNSSVKTLSEEQQEMVKSFSVQSGMKLEWSQKCLDDNEWNYTKAGEVFTILKNEGKIPKEFFK